MNPDWSAKAAAEPGGSRVANQPTGVWLDRIAAIAGTVDGMGLRAHLDAALAQGPAATPSSSSSSSTTCPTVTAPRWPPTASSVPTDDRPLQDRVHRPDRRDHGRPEVRATCGSSRSSRSTRCPTWSPTPAAPPRLRCDGHDGQRHLRQGRPVRAEQAARDPQRLQLHRRRPPRLARLGHATSARPPTCSTSTVRGTTGGFASVDGFITNTANYSRADRAVLHHQHHGRTAPAVRQSKWVDWNHYVDELTFAAGVPHRSWSRTGFNVRHRHADRHLPQRLGRLRPARPAPSTSTDVNTFVNAVPHRPPHPRRQLVQPERRRPRRAAAGDPGHRHRRLRLDQAAGRVRRLQHA